MTYARKSLSSLHRRRRSLGEAAASRISFANAAVAGDDAFHIA